MTYAPDLRDYLADAARRLDTAKQFHGAPKIMLWDKGSANTSASVRALCDALKVEHKTHILTPEDAE